MGTVRAADGNAVHGPATMFVGFPLVGQPAMLPTTQAEKVSGTPDVVGEIDWSR